LKSQFSGMVLANYWKIPTAIFRLLQVLQHFDRPGTPTMSYGLTYPGVLGGSGEFGMIRFQSSALLIVAALTRFRLRQHFGPKALTVKVRSERS
jgi:hypothetical protein